LVHKLTREDPRIQYAEETNSHPEWKRYKGRKNGRHDFQIDLGLALIEMGIKMDWEDPFNEADKPKWMPQHMNFYVPCDCGKCFFCETHKTNGIEHKQNRVGVPVLHKVGCTHGRYKISEYLDHCKLCYHKRRQSHEEHETSKESRKKCNKSRMGCRGCKIPVCEDCWEEYNHDM
jgi:hypothetical protein